MWSGKSKVARAKVCTVYILFIIVMMLPMLACGGTDVHGAVCGTVGATMTELPNGGFSCD